MTNEKQQQKNMCTNTIRLFKRYTSCLLILKNYGQNIIMWQELYLAVETFNVNSCVNCYKWTLSGVKKYIRGQGRKRGVNIINELREYGYYY